MTMKHKNIKSRLSHFEGVPWGSMEEVSRNSPVSLKILCPNLNRTCYIHIQMLLSGNIAQQLLLLTLELYTEEKWKANGNKAWRRCNRRFTNHKLQATNKQGSQFLKSTIPFHHSDFPE